MYISPFVMGILATLGFEIIIIIAAAVFKPKKQ